jgi:hypothetical protein
MKESLPTMPNIRPTRTVVKQLRHPPLKPDAIGYAEFCNRSHDPVIRVYDEAGNVIETHEHKESGAWRKGSGAGLAGEISL